jgi:hypothetical protein
VTIGGLEEFGDHCLVMSRGELVFDPSVSVKCPPGVMVNTFQPSEIAYGLSFDEIEQEQETE